MLAGPPHPTYYDMPAAAALNAAADNSMRHAGYGSPTQPPAPPPKVDKHMKTFELLAMLGPGRSEAQRLQALQVLAVRSGVMQREQQVMRMLHELRSSWQLLSSA
jgi:hypothetical protein